MHHRSYLLVPVIALTILMVAPSCSQKASTPQHLKEQIDVTSMEYASAYICPMHCKGSGSDEPGTCPVCKMDYVKNSKHTGSADDDSLSIEMDSTITQPGIVFFCPEHPAIIGQEGDKCSTCGRKLVEYTHQD